MSNFKRCQEKSHIQVGPSTVNSPQKRTRENLFRVLEDNMFSIEGTRDPLADCNRHLNETFIDSSGSLGWGGPCIREKI